VERLDGAVRHDEALGREHQTCSGAGAPR
jgi:hypothetical protein